MTPLVKHCDDEEEQPQQGYGRYGAAARASTPSRTPRMVCKTWFESTCNTTYSEGIPKPQTWCTKEPRKICAPDNCRMEPGSAIDVGVDVGGDVGGDVDICLAGSTCRLN